MPSQRPSPFSAAATKAWPRAGIRSQQQPLRMLSRSEGAASRVPAAPFMHGVAPRRQRASPPLVAAAAAAAAAAPAINIAGMTDTQRAQQAHDWGYSQLGLPLPDGVSVSVLAETFAPEVFQIDLRQVAARLALAAAAMAAGYAWLWLQHSICPLWQQALCWAVIGTGYTGAFMIASDAAHFAMWPEEPLLQDIVGAALMAPALWPLEAWRLQLFHHLM
jgi:hypothetical protein